ncbi:root hair defective 3 GTP-binding protein [Coemansia reversa NRRL 1564]|uniref:Root hair defective 3 GTP-binding protein n=1 Tax=Coemansia reversa (strain ATCC 12441 / NRRL 1564) TaxID=763665 RepID=A0A2G5B9N8_COERN|nr:root hair defective 3 GTP-binding protein [Coemansia reversa NRRL 1564]|eukprot:PIA15728.1 root hair defective 3 GTP-binding protein [Coemansia reversa NRRL 1564]
MAATSDNQTVPELHGTMKPVVPDTEHRIGSGFPLQSKLTRLQLVDEEQQFSDKLSDYMQQRWQLSTAGFDYDVVAVFGSQSTGKSTLLNRLFGTRFDVMDEGQRQQTTRGIWADRGTDGMPVLIMDVEGTDGRERGENQDFERKSALFSLAMAEVLLVNMWETMVGLYNGANMGLLKTVMEVNLQLFGGGREGKTLIYFVIRDHVSPTPLENLAKTLCKDMERIWAELSKPSGLETAELSDYFDLKFVSLPHKLLQPEEFEEAAIGLRRQFTDKDSKDYVFRPAYKRQVPADGFAHYAQAVWEKVVSNKDLDLPTQQELLAQYRCDEIAAAALEPFRAALEPLRPRVRAGEIVDALGSVGGAARSQAIKEFDEQAARYHAAVYAKKRAAFVQALDGELHALALNQVKNALAQATETFSTEGSQVLEDAAKNDGDDAGKGFAEVVGSVRRRVRAWFDKVVAGLAVDEDSAGAFAAETRQLEAMLDATTAKLRTAEMERVLEQLRRTTRETLSEETSDQLNSPGSDGMWAGVMGAFDTASQRADEQLQRRMERAEVADGDTRRRLEQRLHRGLWEDLVALLREEVADQMVLLRLRGALEDRFRYDASGLPRVWRPTDDIDAHFAQARSSAQALLPLFSRIDPTASRVLTVDAYFPSGFDPTPTLTLISGSRLRDLARRFGREADALYLEAKRALVATQSHVPPWVLVLLVLLGWNEAMTILFNPLYLVLTALVAGTALVLHNLRLWGPAIRAVSGLANVANDHVHNLLVEAVNRTDPARNNAPPLRRSRSHQGPRSDDIELEPLPEGTSSQLSLDSEDVSSRNSSSERLHSDAAITSK